MLCDIAGISDKRRVLQEIDTDFDISFSTETEQYSIYHKGYLFQNVDWNGFTRKVLDHIRRMVWLNRNGLVESEIDNNNNEIDKAKEKKIEDMAYNLAKDIRKPLLKDYYGA